MSTQERSVRARLLVALVATGAAAGLRAILPGLAVGEVPYATMVIAVVISAWYGGMWPALISTTLGAVLAQIFFIAPALSPTGESPHEITRLLFFLAISTLIGLFAQKMHTIRLRLAERNRMLLQEAEQRKLAEQRERAHREHLNMTLQGIGDGVIVTDSAGIVTLLNPVAERLVGWSTREALGRPVEEVFVLRDPGRPEAPNNPALQALRYGRVTGHPGELLLVRRDGALGPAEANASPIRDHDGTLVGSALVFRDVTERRRAERALRESESELSDFFENANVGLHWTSGEGVIIRANREELEMLGYSEEEYIGHQVTEFHLDAEVITSILERLHRGERIDDEPARLRARDGTIRHVLISSTARWSDDGRFMHSRCFTVDVTARVEAEAMLQSSEARFRTVADNIPILAWTADPAGGVTWFNKRWHDYTGLALEQASDFRWNDLVHPRHLERVRDSLARTIEHGVAWEDTFPVRGTDGTYRWFLARSVPITDTEGRIAGWFGTGTDVTDRVEIEGVLRDGDRRKDEFLATLAHELRNPLAPVRFALDRLGGHSTPDEVERLRGVLARQLGHVSRLVDDLIDVSRISSGKLEIRRSIERLETIVTDALESIRPECEARQLRLEVRLPEQPVSLEGDKVRLTQALVNLLGNASKFSDEGGCIRLLASTDADEVIIAIEDEGIGIPAERMGMIFDLFAQGHERTEDSRGGLGIGLTIVRRIVEMHQGTLTVSSEGSGRGSRFVIRLPVIRAEAPAAVATMAPLPVIDARWLVADDNVDSADTLAMLLQMSGRQVEVVYDGDAAVRAFAHSFPDIVLLDIGMPVRNGYEACRMIRSTPAGAEAVIIALTGWGQAEDRRKSREAGFDGHLVKPVDYHELLRVTGELRARGREVNSIATT